MKPQLLLLGGETSLGKVFATLAAATYDVQWSIDHPRVIVNCRGRNHLHQMGDELNTEDLQLMADNVMPVFHAINSIVRMGLGPCKVLNVASQTYRIPQTNTALYAASKAALVQLTRVLARELAPDGWVINSLAPGKIADTEMARKTDEQVLELRGWTAEEAEAYSMRNIPMRRYTSCVEVSTAMLKILELPSYINGACIDMTGGA
jgi:NAD(P)-dependent dehydrogenase (short-subunit alcohol dehydrogenase family)